MRGRSRRSKGKLSDEVMKKYIRLMAVPAAVVVLLLVILLMGRGSGNKEPEIKTAGTEAVTDAAVVDSTEETSLLDVTGYELKQDEIPELTALVQAYCYAKADCDPAALYQVFGEEKTEEELAKEKAKMELAALSVEEYVNISCYSMDGPEPDTYVIYPYFEIQYKEAQLLMPSLSWCYAKKDAEGQFYMTQEVSDSERDYIAQISKSDAVSQLITQTEEKIREAIAGDEELKRIYEE